MGHPPGRPRTDRRVYTAQGFECDWPSRIIGPCLVWRGNHWVTYRTKSKDPLFRKSRPDTGVDRLICDTYMVLLRPGMVGTLVYSTDLESQERLRELAGARPHRSELMIPSRQ